MTTATTRTLFSFPTLLEPEPWAGGAVSSLYRSIGWNTRSYFAHLSSEYSFDTSPDGSWANVAHSIWHEAQRFDTLTDAYNDHALYLAALLTNSEPVMFDQDTEAAFVQAELLGATADQRAKLRAIVTARVNAEHAVEVVRRQLVETRRQLEIANEDILDGHDPRTMQLFANTGAVADRQGLCSVYDQIARDSLIPTRPELAEAGYVGDKGERDYRVTVNVMIEVTTSVSVMAVSEDDAATKVSEMSHRDIWDDLDLGGASHYDISSFDTVEVTEDY